MNSSPEIIIFPKPVSYAEGLEIQGDTVAKILAGEASDQILLL